MAEDDPIKKLLLQTGWSYTEILEKLEAYRNFTSPPQQQVSSTTVTNDENDLVVDDKSRESPKICSESASDVTPSEQSVIEDDPKKGTEDSKDGAGIQQNGYEDQTTKCSVEAVKNCKSDTMKNESVELILDTNETEGSREICEPLSNTSLAFEDNVADFKHTKRQNDHEKADSKNERDSITNIVSGVFQQRQTENKEVNDNDEDKEQTSDITAEVNSNTKCDDLDSSSKIVRDEPEIEKDSSEILSEPYQNNYKEAEIKERNEEQLRSAVEEDFNASTVQHNKSDGNEINQSNIEEASEPSSELNETSFEHRKLEDKIDDKHQTDVEDICEVSVGDNSDVADINSKLTKTSSQQNTSDHQIMRDSTDSSKIELVNDETETINQTSNGEKYDENISETLIEQSNQANREFQDSPNVVLKNSSDEENLKLNEATKTESNNDLKETTTCEEFQKENVLNGHGLKKQEYSANHSNSGENVVNGDVFSDSGSNTSLNSLNEVAINEEDKREQRINSCEVEFSLKASNKSSTEDINIDEVEENYNGRLKEEINPNSYEELEVEVELLGSPEMIENNSNEQMMLENEKSAVALIQPDVQNINAVTANAENEANNINDVRLIKNSDKSMNNQDQNVIRVDTSSTNNQSDSDQPIEEAKMSYSEVTPPATPNDTSFKIAPHNVNRLNTITQALFKKLSMTEDNLPALSDVDDEMEETSDIGQEELQQSRDSKDSLLSNESPLKICNVIGGYVSPTGEDISTASAATAEYETNLNKPPSRKENRLVGKIMPRKTTDVTKIKGWKKKFALSTESSGTLTDKVTEISKPTTSNESKVSDAITQSYTDEVNSSSQTNSAFISPVLDQFLTENAHLNISYEVPKLEAEQTVTKYIDIQFPQVAKHPAPPTVAKTSGYKPKTLAEKRKMLESMHEKPEMEDLLSGMSAQELEQYKANAANMLKKLIKENTPFTRRCFLTSSAITNKINFVLYNGKKFKVPSSNDREIITSITEKKVYKTALRKQMQLLTNKPFGPSVIPVLSAAIAPNPLLSQKKPSLLENLKVDIKAVPFYPDEWDDVQVKLPKLSLEVKPMLGRRIHPKLEHLIEHSGTVLSKARVEFALSALKFHKPNTQIFQFPIKFKNNQIYTTMKKRRIVDTSAPENPVKPTVAENAEDIAQAVNVVVAKLLDYVDAKEATQDVVRSETDSESIDKFDTEEESVSPTNRNWRRRRRTTGNEIKNVRKTTLEMRRLNCKIVNISVEEENAAVQPCSKDFCKLGCICKSIECKPLNLLPGHCGLPRCMFRCTCICKNTGVGENISLSAGTEFSDGLINRIQDEATKDLAKEEKEFTQTVIKTHNQIIMIGDSKERRRRTTKVPKKYNDYVEDPDLPMSLRVEDPLNFEITDSSSVRALRIKKNPGYVPLIRYDFGSIIPYCMVHSLYKCHCKGTSTFDATSTEKNIVGYKLLNSSRSPQKAPKNGINMKKAEFFDKEVHCSRTRGLATSYYFIRNKSESFKARNRRSAKKFETELFMSMQAKADFILEGFPLEFLQSVPEGDKSAITKGTKRNPRKQSLIVLEDSESTSSAQNSKPSVSTKDSSHTKKEMKLQRRKTKPKDKSSQGKSVQESPSVVAEVQKMSDLSQFLNSNSSNLRLMPWSKLVEHYLDESYQIWHTKITKDSPVLITESGRRPTKHHYNIKLYRFADKKSTVPLIVKCILTNTVPLNKSADNVFLLLLFRMFCWEICGLCENNKSNNSAKDKLSISMIDNWNNLVCFGGPQLNGPSVADIVGSRRTNEEKTEFLLNKNDPKMTIFYSKMLYHQKKLISDDGDSNDVNIRQVVWSALPDITIACKWRVLYLNINFAYLSLSNGTYTIKREYIMKALKMANEESVTVCLKCEKLSEKYAHDLFGLYFVSNHSDKIFIGPYYLNENHDLNTLTYMNSFLFDTSTLNHMQGKSASVNGRWFYQDNDPREKPPGDDDVQIVQNSPAVVDLTLESDDESSSKNQEDSLLAKEQLLLEPIPSIDESLVIEKDAVEEARNISFEKQQEKIKADEARNISFENQQEKIKADEALNVSFEKQQEKIQVDEARNISFEKQKEKIQVDEARNISFEKQKEQIKADEARNISFEKQQEKIKADETRNISFEKQQEKSSVVPLNNNLILWTTEPKTVLNQSPKTEDQLVDHQQNDLCGSPTTADNEKSHMLLNLFSQLDNYVPDINNLRYFITNVPNLGFIPAYQRDTSKCIYVINPIIKRIKKFTKVEVAVEFLESVLKKRLIAVPISFTIKVKMTQSLRVSLSDQLDPKMLDGFHIVGGFGVKNTLHTSAAQLRSDGFGEDSINYVLTQRRHKFIWSLPSPVNDVLSSLTDKYCMLDALTMDHIADVLRKEILSLRSESTKLLRQKTDLRMQNSKSQKKWKNLVLEMRKEQRSREEAPIEAVSLNDTETVPLISQHARNSSAEKTELIELIDDDDEVKIIENLVVGEDATEAPVKIICAKNVLRKQPVAATTSTESSILKALVASPLTPNFSKPRLILPNNMSKLDLSKCTFRMKVPNCDKVVLKNVKPITSQAGIKLPVISSSVKVAPPKVTIPKVAIPIATKPTTMTATSCAKVIPVSATISSSLPTKNVVISNSKIVTPTSLFAFKDGHMYEYQFVPTVKQPYQPGQAIKRSASSIIIQPPAKKLATTATLLTSTQKTDNQ